MLGLFGRSEPRVGELDSARTWSGIRHVRCTWLSWVLALVAQRWFGHSRLWRVRCSILVVEKGCELVYQWISGCQCLHSGRRLLSVRKSHPDPDYKVWSILCTQAYRELAYTDSGWPHFEWSVSQLVKPADLTTDLPKALDFIRSRANDSSARMTGSTWTLLARRSQMVRTSSFSRVSTERLTLR